MTNSNDRLSMRANFKTLIVAAGAAIMVAACSGRQADSTSPAITGDRLGARTISGTWATTGIGPVYRESMKLTQVGDHVSGEGTYAIEAGRSGPTTIDGAFSGKTVTLTITRDYGLVERFSGTLTDATHLAGTLAIESSKQSFTLVKQ
jgi:hypothetical protein